MYFYFHFALYRKAAYILKLSLFQHLESVIKTRIPGIASLINRSIDELEAELDHLGRPVAIDAGVRNLHLCYLFFLFIINLLALK